MCPVMTTPPLIGLPACRLHRDGHVFHTLNDTYARAVAEHAGGLPVALPVLDRALSPDAVLARVDGLVLTGSPSNVHPEAYGGAAHAEAEPYDTPRDALTLPLIHAAVRRGTPVLAICRGMQELNVALGGTLHACVHEVPGRADHRHPEGTVPDRFAPAHTVTIHADGVLGRLLGAGALTVNSLHRQAVARPAAGLHVEASAADGTVEAVSLPGAPGFALGVQWHPEYCPGGAVGTETIFGAFAAAVRGEPGVGRAA